MMQKILKLLEGYVQWGILGLGALFLLYIIWSYLYLNPAARPITVAGHPEPAAPGVVDHLIADGPASILEQRMRETGSVQIPVQITADIDLSGSTTRPADSQPVWDSWKVDLAKVIPPVDLVNQGGKISALPTLPALKFVDQEPLRTVLNVNNAAGQPAHQDQDSITTFWSLPIGDLAKAYRAALGSLPQPKQTALIVRTSLIRQEQLPGGDWGSETVIALPFNAPPVPAYPATGDQQQSDAYLTWVKDPTNEQWFVTPPFPAVAFTDRADLQWQPLKDWVNYRAHQQAIDALPVSDVTPTTPATPAVPTPSQPLPTTAPPVAPVTPPPFVPRGGRSSNGSGQGGRGSGFGGGGFAGGGRGMRGATAGQTPPPAPVAAAPVPPPAAAPVSANPFGPAPAGGPTSPTAPTPQPVVNVAPVVLPTFQDAPTGEFNPGALASAGDALMYFHDLTVEPGKTYRYKARYTLYNPVYNVPNQKPELAAVFGIDSTDSSWTDAITVPARTRFWCMAKQPFGLPEGEVAFAVFSWHDGLWQQKNYSASPGDEIGANEADTGNFLTHWTLLDVKSGRAGSPTRTVLLTPDDGGLAQERGLLTDGASQEFKHFMRDFNAQPKPDNTPAGPATQPGQ